jgi:hypothetical protein
MTTIANKVNGTVDLGFGEYGDAIDAELGYATSV